VRSSRDGGESGHALVDASLALGLAAGALALAAGLFREEWNETRCLRQVFEAGHARLIGRAFIAPEVRIEDHGATLLAEGCSTRARARIEFVRLEDARW
jgi:hypothetical protein